MIEGHNDISLGKRSSNSLMPLSVFGGNNSKDIEGELPVYISENLIAKNQHIKQVWPIHQDFNERSFIFNVEFLH